MKKVQLSIIAMAGCLALFSCDSNDDDNNGNGNLADDLTGTYELSRLNAPSAQDYDNDGDSNADLVLEGSCYNASWITFRQDGTYEEHLSTTTTADGGVTLDCDMAVSSGTYVQNGNTVTTTRTSGEGSASTTFTFNAESHTLVATNNNGNYTAWNEATSLFVNLTGNLQMTFTKYTEDEDDNGNGQEDEDNVNSTAFAEVVGNFDLTSFLVANVQNLDNDADNSANLVTESNCYGSSNITINGDGTYSREWSESLVGSLGTSLSCDTHTQAGIWTRQGDRIILRRVSGDASVNNEFMLDTENNTLSQSNNQQYPTYNSATSVYAMLTGAVNIVYSKDN